MFTKLQQRSWIKIELPRDLSTQECFRDCVKRCHITHGTLVIPFNDNLRTGRPHAENKTVQLLGSLLDADRQWIARELAAEI